MKSWQEYDVALRKWDTKGETQVPLLVAAVGISGEVGELIEVLEKLAFGGGGGVGGGVWDELIGEMGDTIWYVRAVGNRIGFSIGHLVEHAYTLDLFVSFERSAIRLGVLQGKVIDILKKSTWHGKGLEGLDDALLQLLGEVRLVAEEFSVDLLAEVAQANVDKLEYRYQEGFVEGGGRR